MHLMSHVYAKQNSFAARSEVAREVGQEACE